MEKGLVSIMMPVYNGAALINASIQSLLNQTYTNWECIIIDDGSTDKTPEMLDSLQDSRFVIRHQPNKGRPFARQYALDLANGEYIAMLDAEDLYHPDKLRRQIKLLESNPDVVGVTTAMCSFGTKTDKVWIRGAQETKIMVYDGTNCPSHAPSLLRASIAKKCKYNPKLRLGEDVDFLEKYFNYGDKFIMMSDVLYYYSELDSVSKYKIRNNYMLFISKYFKEKRYSTSILYLLKYIYTLFVFPFLSIERILAKRGYSPSEQQKNEYKQYCYDIVQNNLYSKI